MTFEGSGAVEKFAEWLFPFIKSMLISEIEKFACAEITTLVGQNLTEALGEINKQLIPYMNHGFKVFMSFACLIK